MVSLEAGIQLYDADITLFSSGSQLATITNGGVITCTSVAATGGVVAATLSGDGTAITHIQYQNVDGLATVGHTGAYGDLTGTPTNLNQFTNCGQAYNGVYRYAHMGDIADIQLLQGPTGAAGANGAAGDKGDKGDKGDTGATGASGVAGVEQVCSDWLATSGTSNILNKPYALFENIALNRYVKGVTATVSTPNNYGTCTITLSFTGNSPTYNYALHFYGTSTFDATGSCGATGSFTHSFATGTYYMTCVATTAGTGEGSSYTTPTYICTIVVGVTDTIGSPSISASSYSLATNCLKYVDGLPYYSNGTAITFNANNLNFANVKANINPTTVFSNFLTLAGNSGNADYTHANVFGGTTLALNMTNTNAVAISINNGSLQVINVSGLIRNVNYPNGGNWATLASGFYYVHSGFGVPALPISWNVQLNSSSITSPGGYFSPFESFWRSNPQSVPRGQSPPSYGGTTISNVVVFNVTSTLGLTAFVVNVDTDSVSTMTVSWASGTAYDAKTHYTLGGCGNATYAGGTRFPVRCPTDRTSAETITIAFTFGTWLRGVSLTNS